MSGELVLAVVGVAGTLASVAASAEALARGLDDDATAMTGRVSVPR
ncbi:hypothetical protein P3T36_006359 [Kitasatospora sp. MAP12-15]|nr:hypothetical protein [Kitasatospora sp. MAP12-44]MDH6107900.1 hypothetical protein [Kitasatospora sp. MAP12-44]